MKCIVFIVYTIDALCLLIRLEDIKCKWHYDNKGVGRQLIYLLRKDLRIEPYELELLLIYLRIGIIAKRLKLSLTLWQIYIGAQQSQYFLNIGFIDCRCNLDCNIYSLLCHVECANDF